MSLKQKLVALGLSSAVALAGANLIAPTEAPNGEPVLHTYLDPVEVITACFGHTDPELEINQFLASSNALKCSPRI